MHCAFRPVPVPNRTREDKRTRHLCHEEKQNNFCVRRFIILFRLLVRKCVSLLLLSMSRNDFNVGRAAGKDKSLKQMNVCDYQRFFSIVIVQFLTKTNYMMIF